MKILLAKKKKVCNHEYDYEGKYYKEELTEYRNCFDKVHAYRRYRCKHCGEIHDELISTEKFKPIMHYSREERRDAYIRHIQELGYSLETDLYER